MRKTEAEMNEIKTKARKLFKQGLSYEEVAKVLNAQGLTTRTGKRYSSSHVWFILNQKPATTTSRAQPETTEPKPVELSTSTPPIPTVMISDVIDVLQFCKKLGPAAKRSVANFLLADSV